MVVQKKPDIDVILIGLQLIIFAALIIFVFPHSSDDKMMKEIKRNGDIYETNRAVVWVEKGYLEPKAAKEFSVLVDKGINDIEKYTGLRIQTGKYASEKVNYYCKGGKFVSHACECGMFFRKNNIVLASVVVRAAPYLKETVKLMTCDNNIFWIREGLALYLNDKLGGWPTWPNFGIGVDEKSREFFQEGSPVKFFALELFKKVGENSAPDFEIGEFEIYCMLSASFVKYLDEQLGTVRLMQIYRARDPKKEIVIVTGKSIDKWKDAWFKRITE